MKTIGINFDESYPEFFFSELSDKKDRSYNTVITVTDKTYKNLTLGEDLYSLCQKYFKEKDGTFSASAAKISNFNELFAGILKEYTNE